MKLKFHTKDFEKTALEREEPEESLEELLKEYNEACDAFLAFKKKREAVKDEYTKIRTKADGTVEKYIDYEAMETDDEAFQIMLADFNAFNALDMMQFDIDVKIAYMNKRQSEQ